jgi:hypothetical protein
VTLDYIKQEKICQAQAPVTANTKEADQGEQPWKNALV